MVLQGLVEYWKYLIWNILKVCERLGLNVLIRWASYFSSDPFLPTNSHFLANKIFKILWDKGKRHLFVTAAFYYDFCVVVVLVFFFQPSSLSLIKIWISPFSNDKILKGQQQVTLRSSWNRARTLFCLIGIYFL